MLLPLGSFGGVALLEYFLLPVACRDVTETWAPRGSSAPSCLRPGLLELTLCVANAKRLIRRRTLIVVRLDLQFGSTPQPDLPAPQIRCAAGPGRF